MPDHIVSLPTHLVGRRLHVYRCLDSTNRLGLELAQDENNDGLVVLAHEQTAGRGQFGRSWTAPPRSSVLLSVVLFPPPHLRRAALLTAWAAVSVCSAIGLRIADCGLQIADGRLQIGKPDRSICQSAIRNPQSAIGIKWPNDVLIQGKKVCGILIEQRADSRGNLATVVGIGLNVNQSPEFFAQANLPLATSLAIVTNQEHDVDAIARLLITELDAQYYHLCAGDLATLEECWKERLGLLGQQVIVQTAEKNYHGRLRDVTFQQVTLELEDQKAITLCPEIIRHIDLA